MVVIYSTTIIKYLESDSDLESDIAPAEPMLQNCQPQESLNQNSIEADKLQAFPVQLEQSDSEAQSPNPTFRVYRGQKNNVSQ